MTEGKTLTELTVQPGDVVRHVSHKDFTIAGIRDNGEWFAVGQDSLCGLCDDPVWHIVSRANAAPEPELKEQIAALQVRLDALPKMMRLYGVSDGMGSWQFTNWFAADCDTHYIDIPVDADGVPIGLMEIKK